MQLDGAFRVLLIPLLLVIEGSSETVPPPTNLTLSCDNFNVTARWKYNHPYTKFMVQINDGPRSYETTNHHFDLSPSIWKSEEHYLGVYYIHVTAILGDVKSSRLTSESLSYNDLKTTDIQCQLAFPPVDLKVVDEERTVTFRNPLYFYEYLQQAVKSDTTVFEFSVTVNYSEIVSVKCNTEDCLQRISLPDSEAQCVKLEGKLCAQPDFRCVVFNETDLICQDESSDLPWIVLGVLLFVTVIAVIVLTIMICWTKSWTLKKEEPTLPNPLLKVQPATNHRTPYVTLEKDDCNTITLIDKTTCTSSSVSSEEEDLLDGGDGGDRDGSLSCYTDGKVLDNSNPEPELGYGSTDDDSAKDSMNTESVVLDLDVEQEESEDKEMEQVSPYDCPHNPTLTIRSSHRR